ncbi:MAG TPA: (2Fe-2S)-binding protein [Candidatus Binataceae bacterium]|nr:(2Fe-2S)-binding protein [Candidatus Binataceae bacterium]
MSSDRRKPTRPPAITRRSFLKRAVATGAGAVAATLAHLPAGEAAGNELAEGIAEHLGPGAVAIDLRINGELRRIAVEPRVTLLRALREHLGLTGTKLVCDRGACGACTVHLDGRPVTSCMMLAVDARGHEITTIEGLGSPARMHPVQSAFVEADALQCGFCTPGLVMSVAAAISRNPSASPDEIRRAVAGNICRCGAYPHVFDAALKLVRGGRKQGIA